MTEHIIISNATERDLQPMLDVYNEAILHTTAVYQEETHTLAMRRKWFEEKQQAGLPVFVAYLNAEFAGFSSYGPFRNWPGYRYTVEHSVYVAAGFRGRGIGKKLVKALIEHARHQKIHVIIAGIDAAGEASIGLHLSLGFKEVAYFKEVGFKFDRWLDLKFFELILD
ncbi:MAG TPA: GNAT family N-acetyltransferase [Puia sp.]|nr:GNAT family N-acetyltransferase [Puia sp.]